MEKDPKNPKDPEIGQKFSPTKKTGWEITVEEEISKERENTASILAKIIIWAFVLLSGFASALLFTNEYSSKVIECINIIFHPFATLIGVVFGFYFSQSRIK